MVEVRSSTAVLIKGFKITPSLDPSITEVESGIAIRSNSRNCTIAECTIINFNGTVIFGTKYGIYLKEVDECIIRDNTLRNNIYGILSTKSDGSSNHIIHRNFITENEYGIQCEHWGEDGNNILKAYENDLRENGYGIRLSQSMNNKFYHNNFINNNVQVQILEPGYSNFWDNGYPSGGNYWSDYGGSDDNSDGIGDTEYIINGDNQDRFPVMEIIPEFPSLILLAVFLVATLLATLKFKCK